MQKITMHNLRIVCTGKTTRIFLDEFEIHGVSEYKVSKKAGGLALLEISLHVDSDNIEITSKKELSR